MKFDEMNPAPPVTSTRFGNSDLPVDRVQRSPLDVALDPTEVLADEREDEPLDPEHECEQRAHSSERDADPLDRLRPEAGEHVQREPRQPQRRVPRTAAARSM